MCESEDKRKCTEEETRLPEKREVVVRAWRKIEEGQFFLSQLEGTEKRTGLGDAELAFYCYLSAFRNAARSAELVVAEYEARLRGRSKSTDWHWAEKVLREIGDSEKEGLHEAMREARDLDVHEAKRDGKVFIEVVPVSDLWPLRAPEEGIATWTRGGLPARGVTSLKIRINGEFLPALDTAKKYLEIVKDVLRRANYAPV